MSSTLRLKIEYRESDKQDESSLKFIYVIDSSDKTTINELIKKLQNFIVTEFGYKNIHLMDLATDDGYLLTKHYICAHVLNNNEKLLCIDMDQFIGQNRNTFDIEEAWLRLEQQDDSDDIEKSLTVGMNNAGKLYIYLFAGHNMQKLYVFTISELLAMVRNGQNEIDHMLMKIPETAASDWFISAQWMHDSTLDKALLLVASLKTGDTTHILIKKLRINLNESTKTIEKGEVISLSNPPKDDINQRIAQAQARLDQLKKTIPPPIKTGPVLDTENSDNQIQKHECEGDSSIRMMQGKNSTVDIQQEPFARNDNVSHTITITDVILSKKLVVLPEILNQKRSTPAEKPISIAHVNVQYQRHDEKWLDCQDATIEIASPGQDDRRKIVTSILNIEPDKLISVSIHAIIRVKGKPGTTSTTRARAHKSLPQPLKFKIIFTDSQSKTCSLIIEQMNDPLNIITKDKYLEDHQSNVKELIAFVYADDYNEDERIFVAVYINQDNCLVIAVQGRYTDLQKTDIRSMQFKAKKSGETEKLVEFISDSNKKATLLFDSETFLLYAIRIEITTTTSKTVEPVLLPLNAIM